MILRKHQTEMVEVCDDILTGAQISRIIAAVTPGGGKSALPIILSEKLIPTFADRILWVVPRNSLKYQGEADFCDPYWETHHRLRAANGNESDPVRGTSGYITTYQAIGLSPAEHLQEVRSHRYIVFLDEPHHIRESGAWENAVKDLIDSAVLNIFASGTLSRGDGQRIAFLDYDDLYVDLNGNENTRVIQYSRSDALRDGAICPVQFHTIDGSAEWEKDGETHEVETLSRNYEKQGDALFTALRTEYAYQLLSECLEHWKQEVIRWPLAKMLVVAPDIKTAKKYHDWLYRRGVYSKVATSEDSPQARQHIEEYKRGVFDVLTTVGMAYEGLSVKQITHIACLTHIRSIPWLEQCFGRGNRVCPGKLAGHVFAPADPRFMKAIRMIEREQLVTIDEIESRDGAEQEKGEDIDGNGEGKPKVNPLRSQAHVYAEGSQELFTQPIQAVPPSVQEAALRKQIREYRRLWLQAKRNGAIQTAARLFDRYVRMTVNKKLDDMTISELVSVWERVKERFG